MTDSSYGSTAVTGGSTTEQIKEQVRGQGLAESARGNAQDVQSVRQATRSCPSPRPAWIS
jgi:hypothetical protein